MRFTKYLPDLIGLAIPIFGVLFFNWNAIVLLSLIFVEACIHALIHTAGVLHELYTKKKIDPVYIYIFVLFGIIVWSFVVFYKEFALTPKELTVLFKQLVIPSLLIVTLIITRLRKPFEWERSSLHLTISTVALIASLTALGAQIIQTHTEKSVALLIVIIHTLAHSYANRKTN